MEPARASPQSRFAVAIIEPALVGIAQHVVRLGDRLELLFRFLRSVVAIGVARHRQLAIRCLYLELARAACDAERVVKISHDFWCSPSIGRSAIQTYASPAKLPCRRAYASAR